MARSLGPLVLGLAGVLVWAGGPPGLASAAGGVAPCVDPHRPDCAASIQAAVDAAQAGARITVAAGTYHEQVTVTKTLGLRAQGRVVIDATGQSHGLYVDGAGATGTTVEGFTIENAQLEGVLVQDTSGVVVRDNTVRANDRAWQGTPGGEATCPGALPFEQDDCGEGLHLLGVAAARVEHNLVERNVGGILLTDETGPTHDNLV